VNTVQVHLDEALFSRSWI